MCEPVTAGLIIGGIATAASVGFGVVSAVQSSNQAAAQNRLAINAQRAQADAAFRQQQFSQQQAQLQQQNTADQRRLQLQQQLRQQNQALKSQQQQTELSRQQSNAQLIQTFQQQKSTVINQRAQILAQNEIDRLAFQQSKEEAQEQIKLNNQGTSRAFIAEQAKLNEVRKKALFEQQNILAKAIGTKGSILASGQSGQSIGLLVADVDRQAGFAEAQELATLDSARDQAVIALDTAYLQNESANNQAISSINYNPPNPYLPKPPEAPQLVGLGISNPYI